MNGIFRTFLSLSLSGSLLILVLLLCRPLLRNRLSRRWQYYIWLVVIARLLLPLSPEASLMGTLFREPAPAVISLPAGDAGPLPLSPAIPAADAVSPSQDASPAIPDRDAAAILRQNLWAVWLAVAAILLIRKITVYQSFGKYMRAGCSEISDIALLDCLAEVCGQLGIKRPVELYENSLASSPMLLGIFKPCIILPDAGLSGADFQYTARHELTHYRRRDLLYKWLVQLTVCLHWFNPLVWLMAREAGRDCELSCDEAVIQALEPGERRAYGDMLLRAMAAGGSYHSPAGSVTLSEGGELLKERLGAIMNFRKCSKLAGVCSVLLAALLLMGAAAAGAYTPSNSLKGDASAGFRYTQEGYYQAPYLFEIGWNVQKDAEKSYYHTQLPLSDGSDMTVLLTDSCKGSLQDTNVLDALTAVLSRLKKESAAADFPLTRPLVISVRNTGSSSAAGLAEESYQEQSIASYSAAFALLDEAAQRNYLEQCYADGEIAFFAAGIQRIAKDSPLAEEFAEKAYTDGNYGFFSVVVNNAMSDAAIDAWAARAIQDNQLAFSSILVNASDTDYTQDVKKMEAEREKQQLEEYKKFGITKDGTNYYYQNQLVNAFIDLNADKSFVTFSTNPKGAVNINITRGTDGKISRVDLMTKEEIEALFNGDISLETILRDEPDASEDDWDWGDAKKGSELAEDVFNVSKEDLSGAVLKLMAGCDAESWYLIHSGGRQYIYCGSFPWLYGYAPQLDGSGWTIDFMRFRERDHGYLLLSLPDGLPVSAVCDGEPVALTDIQ